MKTLVPLLCILLMTFIFSCSSDDPNPSDVKANEDIGSTQYPDLSKYDMYAINFESALNGRAFIPKFSELKDVIYNDIILQQGDITFGVYLGNKKSYGEAMRLIEDAIAMYNQDKMLTNNSGTTFNFSSCSIVEAKIGFNKESNEIEAFSEYSSSVISPSSVNLPIIPIPTPPPPVFNINNIPNSGSVDAYASGSNRVLKNTMKWLNPQFSQTPDVTAYEHDIFLNNQANSSLGPGTYISTAQDALGYPIYVSWSSNLPSAYNDTRVFDTGGEISFTIGCGNADVIQSNTEYYSTIIGSPGLATQDNAKLTAVPSVGYQLNPSVPCRFSYCIFSINGLERRLVNAWDIPLPVSNYRWTR